MSKSLEQYMKEREGIQRMMCLPCDVRKRIISNLCRPVHPLARKMKRFIKNWEETIIRGYLSDDVTILGSGVMSDMISLWDKKTGSSLSVNYIGLINSIYEYFIRTNKEVKVTMGCKRALLETYEVFIKYDMFDQKVPSLMDIRGCLRGI